jgi:ribonuclease VapC
MRRFVLDAWAILALIQSEEPAATQVKQLLEEAQTGQISLFISIINLGEVYYQIGKVKGQNEAPDLSQIGSLNLR